MKTLEQAPSTDELRIDAIDAHIEMNELIGPISYTEKPKDPTPEPKKRNRLGLKGTLAAGIALNIAALAPGAALAQEGQPEQDPINPNSPTLTEPSSNDEASPISAVNIEGTDEQTADSEAEDTEPISTYEKLVNLVSSAVENDQIETDTDINELSDKIIDFYNANDNELALAKEVYGATPKKLLNKSINELESEEIESRELEIVSTPLHAMLRAFVHDESEEMLRNIKEYIILTIDEMPEEYISEVLATLEYYKPAFDEIEAINAASEEATENEIEVEDIESETSTEKPEMKNIAKLIKEKHQKRSIEKVAKEILKAFKDDEAAIDAFKAARGRTPEELVAECLKNKGAMKKAACAEVAWSTIHTYATLRDEKFYVASDKWLDAILTDKKLGSKAYQKHILKGYNDFKNFYPQIYK